jgi:hypothetical protein
VRVFLPGFVVEEALTLYTAAARTGKIICSDDESFIMKLLLSGGGGTFETDSYVKLVQ